MSDYHVYTTQDYLCDLERFWGAFENVYNDKGRTEEVPRSLQNVLQCLDNLKYSKRDLMFELDIEPLTVDRWRSGGSMKPDTFVVFREFVHDIMQGKLRRPISTADTGFISSTHLFEQRQPMATCIWYLARESFLLSRSRSLKDDVLNLFLAKKQRHSPTLIYLYPRGSMTEVSLIDWKNRLHDIGRDEDLKGSVIGISLGEKGIVKMPWFIPGLRIIMLEIRNGVEGYIRVKTPQPNHDALCKVMGVENEDLQAPWLAVHREEVEQWHTICEERFSKRIAKVLQDQLAEKKDFRFTILEAEEG
jgi:hypothetical protein